MAILRGQQPAERLVSSLRHGAIVALVLAFAAPRPAPAQDRPDALTLLPEKTVALLLCTDTVALAADLQETSFLRIARDQQLRPLLSALYGNAVDALAEVQQQMGVAWEELLQIPQGELAVAVVLPPGERPSLVAIADIDPLSPAVGRLLEEAERIVTREGGTVERLTVEGIEITRCNRPLGRLRQLVYLRHDHTLILGTRYEVIEQLVIAWRNSVAADAWQSLRDCRPFVTAMRRTELTGEAAGQVKWWLDPQELAYGLARGNLAAQAALTLLPVLGLDGLRGVGGSLAFRRDGFDMISQLQIVVDSPREGILKAIATKTGPTEPEDWVPAGAANYATIHVDVPQAVLVASTLVDVVQGEGSFASLAQRVQDRLGVSLEKDLLEPISGRFTRVIWYEPEPGLFAQRTIVGVQLKDPAAFRGTWGRIVQRLGPQLTAESFAGQTYYVVKSRDDNSGGEPAGGSTGGSTAGPARRDPLRFRRPRLCLALVDDYLLVADETTVLREALRTRQAGKAGLAGEEDFQQVAAEVQRQLEGARPAMFTFQRREPSMRNMYRVVLSPVTRERLQRQAAESPFWKAIHESLKQNPPPPFAVIEKYLTAGGGVWLDDEIGWHYSYFTLEPAENP